MANEAEHAVDTPEKNEPGRFRFTLTNLLVLTAACAVCFGVGSWAGDFLVPPPLVGVVLFLAFMTRGRVAPGMILGLATGVLMTWSLPNLPDKNFVFFAFGAMGAAWGGAMHSIVRGHTALGWSTVIFLVLFHGLLFLLIPSVR